jgi:hypothetical protein
MPAQVWRDVDVYVQNILLEPSLHLVQIEAIP